ncbi:MAG: hypothetical protein ACKOVB_02985 [Terrabacter sp.]
MHPTSHEWQLEDPADTLTDIDLLHPFVSGRVVVASVDLEMQVVVAAVPVPDAPSCGWDVDEASALVRRIAAQLVPERRHGETDGGGMTHSLITVVCRRGSRSASALEHRWAEAWVHADPGLDAAVGDIFVVTPSGWHGVTDARSGDEPRLRPRLTVARAADA